MNDAQQQPAPRRPSPREVMPNVARLVDAKRAEYGADHVKECIARGLRGEPGWFYALENGMVQGTPFEGDQVTEACVKIAVALGGRWAMVMRPPAEVKHGA